ncbi:MAG: transposase family protein [Flavobacteriaceae bacterium]|nr:transposase family protein [Flavobacteriaceae bacterium]
MSRISSSAGVQTIDVPWADGFHRFPLFFETWAINLLLATRNQTQKAKLLHCGFQTIHGLLKRDVSRGMKRRSEDPPLPIRLDEKAIQKGMVTRRFSVIRLKEWCLIWWKDEKSPMFTTSSVVHFQKKKENTSKPSPPIGGALTLTLSKNDSLRLP